MSNNPIWTYYNGDKIHAPVYQALDSSTQTLVTNIKGHTRFSDRLDFDAAFIYAHTQGTSDITIGSHRNRAARDGEYVDEYLRR